MHGNHIAVRKADSKGDRVLLVREKETCASILRLDLSSLDLLPVSAARGHANSTLADDLCTVAVSKRPTSESDALIKRQRTDEQDPTLQQLVVAAPDAQGNKGALIQTVRRTSGLSAPIMCLRVSSLPSLSLS